VGIGRRNDGMINIMLKLKKQIRDIQNNIKSEFSRRFWRHIRRLSAHPFKHPYEMIHKLHWQRRLANHRAEGCCFLAASPLHYVCFHQIHALHPEIPIVADTFDTVAYLKRLKVPYLRRLNFPKTVILADYPPAKQGRFPAGVKLIQINHGLGLAKSHYYEAPLETPMDLILVSGALAKSLFNQRSVYNVADVGFPKLDPLFNGSLCKETICRTNGFSASRPIILYAPTWGRFSSLERIIPGLSKLSGEYTIMVKIHDKTAKIFRRRLGQISGITLVDDSDSTPYMFVADLLISDLSSIVFEYALLNRPIILSFPEDDDWKRKVTNPQWWRVGLPLTDLERLPEVVKTALGDEPRIYREFRSQLIAASGICCDGKAALRAAEAIMNRMKEKEG
jgi:hypothetical protein